MKRILIDSVDKRMTIPLISYLKKEAYEIYAICFNGEMPLCKKYIKEQYFIDKNSITENMRTLLMAFDENDLLLVGNPFIIEAINEIKPDIRHIIPNQESIFKATDKRKLSELAKSIGMKVPHEITTPQYPMIGKINVSEGVSLKASERYKIINNVDEYNKAVEYFNKIEGEVLYQNYVSGSGYGVSMLLDNNSQLIDYIVHERILEYPIEGGPSSLCKSIYDDQKVKEAYELLRTLNWTGIAMVEFKGDYLIEINPRFWGSMPLIFKSGSNFFGHYCDLISGFSYNKNEEVQHNQYVDNKYMSYFPQSLVSVLLLLKNKEFSKTRKVIIPLLRSSEGIFSFSNPMPFFRYLNSFRKRGK